jgi:hypothetical protein
MTTGLDDPVIIASITVPSEPLAPLLIDGYALPVTVRIEAAAVYWSVPESVRPATPADWTMRRSTWPTVSRRFAPPPGGRVLIW